jgi:hypothetical protein
MHGTVAARATARVRPYHTTMHVYIIDVYGRGVPLRSPWPSFVV